MAELSMERIEKILHEETPQDESVTTILRSIYIRYMSLYEKYFAVIDTMDDEIAALRNYHEETRSLIKYYFLDIPLDICDAIEKFDDEYTDKLLGPDWKRYLSVLYNEVEKNAYWNYDSKDSLDADFIKKTMSAFYDSMSSIFRVGFDTGSKTSEKVIGGIKEMFFDKDED